MFYGLDDEVPCEQTIRRVISGVKAEETIKFLSEYFAVYQKNSQSSEDEVPLSKRDVIATDGQNIRATRQTKKGNDARKSTGYDLVSLYSTKYGLTISQRAVDKKNHEAEAILEMIATLNLRNCILTWDAINTRATTLEAVVKALADFLVCLKDNQGELFDVIEEAFSWLDVDKFQGEVLSSSRTSTDHGRIETKEISILNAEDILSTELKKNLTHVHSVIRVKTSRIYKSSGVQTEDREDKFFISSITPDGLDASFAATMQDIILSRWQIESRHWVIDVVFGQDALPLRNKEYIENSTVYTKIACNVLSYIRDNVPYYNGKPCFFENLQILARKAQTNFMFLKAFFTKDMSEIKNDERFIGIFYKEREPTGNDVSDNLEVTGHENQIDDSFKLANLVRRSSKIKSKRKLRWSLISESHC
uniref:ISAs1 family transposase n=1 Tax=Succinivibrio sp. TaxID=2053619 RepID=UPI00402AC503